MTTFEPNELIERTIAKNSADIPTAEDIEAFVRDRDPLTIMASLKDFLSKFNFMHESFLAQKRATQRKIPDIQQAIEVVDFLKKKSAERASLTTHFPLTDNCHIKANIPPAESVCLWLGANVMLEYPIAEAEELLLSSSTNANESISKLDENLVFLRDQITTTEVNIARLHNFMVKVKAQLRANESNELQAPVAAK